MEHSSASRRTRVILRHVLPNGHQANIAFENTAAEEFVDSSKLHINDLKTSQANFTVMQDDFNFRPYVSGQDDAAFKALDYICYQGEKTKLISEFPLKHPWETIQPRGSSLVAEDYKGDVAGVARSYIYDCNINGESSSNSYVFLIRVHPDYRRMSLAVYLTGRLFYRDVTEADVQYMTSWVVVDNTPSLGLQDRIAAVGKEAYGMPESETIGSYRCVGTYLDVLANTYDLSIPDDQSIIFRQFTSPSLCASLVTPKYRNAQFFPHDIEQLFASPLSLGVFTMSTKSNQLKESVKASICVWNSGDVRITSFKDSDFRSDGAILLHNAWFHPSPEGQALFLALIQRVCRLMQQKGFKFVNLFLPDKGNNEIHDLYIPIIQQLERGSKINVTWRARVWYVRNKTKLDMKTYPEIFYDPRQALI